MDLGDAARAAGPGCRSVQQLGPTALATVVSAMLWRECTGSAALLLGGFLFLLTGKKVLLVLLFFSLPLASLPSFPSLQSREPVGWPWRAHEVAPAGLNPEEGQAIE